MGANFSSLGACFFVAYTTPVRQTVSSNNYHPFTVYHQKSRTTTQSNPSYSEHIDSQTHCLQMFSFRSLIYNPSNPTSTTFSCPAFLHPPSVKHLVFGLLFLFFDKKNNKQAFTRGKKEESSNFISLECVIYRLESWKNCIL